MDVIVGDYVKLGSYADVSALVLMAYDTLLTTEEEVAFIWQRKFSLGGALYLLTRYFILLELIFDATYDISNFQSFLSVETLINLSWVANISSLVSGISIHLQLIARAYAVSGSNPIIGAGLGSITVAYIAVNIASMSLDPVSGSRSAIFFILETTSDVLVVLSDATVMIITAYFGWREAKQFREVFGNTQRSLTVVFLRQGIIRFLIIVVWGLEVSIGTNVENPFLAGFDARLEHAISGILVCRFILQLRKLHHKPQSMQGPSVQIETAPRFQGRLHRLNETIAEEFGNSGFNYDDTMDNGLVDSGHGPSTDPEVGITIEEFPWAVRTVRDTGYQTS